MHINMPQFECIHVWCVYTHATAWMYIWCLCAHTHATAQMYTCTHGVYMHIHTPHSSDTHMVSMCAYMSHSWSVAVREHLALVGFLLLPCRSEGSNSGNQVWQQAPLLVEPSCWSQNVHILLTQKTQFLWSKKTNKTKRPLIILSPGKWITIYEGQSPLFQNEVAASMTVHCKNHDTRMRTYFVPGPAY